MTNETREASDDVFTAAYLAGTAAHQETEAAPRLRATTTESFALGGLVLTGQGGMRGWVVVEGDVISQITPHKPAGMRAIATEGVIIPGLVDLHGHPEFNVFAPWEPPKTYVNRYAWRGSESYRMLVRDPQNRLLTELQPGTQLRYAEIRAMVGGVTAIQGAGQAAQGRVESLVRNVDGVIFGERHARNIIDLPTSLTGFGGPSLKAALDGIAANDVKALYVHLAEGQRDNQRSIDEFEQLVGLGALTAATVIIHGTAMTREHFEEAASKHAKLVWSPQSNLRLYGETTLAAQALEAGMTVGLGADWLPSGSLSLLAEMKVARQQLWIQGFDVPADKLVAMVTSEAAAIAGLDDKLGTIKEGRAADIVVLQRRDDDLYESVCAATPQDVQLVLIGGDPTYGRDDWVRDLLADPENPILEPNFAWGRQVLVDTSYEVVPDEDPTPRLAQLRADLVSKYPQVGPIWA